MEFAGKVVLITGSSSGIGSETALRFAKLGAQLVLTGRNVVALEKVAKSCKDINKMDPLVINGDLKDEQHVKNLVESTITQFNRLDVLVNNAGILELGSIENTSLEQYDRVFNINVRCIYNLTMQAVPHLVKTKGNIINISSVNGIRSFPNVLAYNMSKAAIEQFTKCVALELAPKQVRVNAVSPGVIITELQKRGGLDENAYAAFLERSKTTHALGRPGEPGEVAETITFLASEKASFITGVSIPVDGGRHAMCPR
ncbi:3-oxoacyl-[acyl-carrier-protein] reductase FabG-like [Halyomorpha halys]|uniref:3-oxoacyl-[acyl-carrier-protein] reductase FabG-like n=1 Tax=Halyomorpha halys TaxID=286706 RepID=UPI0006D4EF27|nr:uncharacterized protein LOC106681212 [Halyomorpha halys]